MSEGPVQVLKPGEIITVRPEIRKYIHEVYTHARFNLKVGLCVQHEHTQRKMEAGLDVEIFDDSHNLDRICEGIREDDKCALIKVGTLSASHTIGSGEYPDWVKQLELGNETFINSFEQVDGSQLFTFKFMGTYKFSELRVRASTYDGSFFFRRHIGLLPTC